MVDMGQGSIRGVAFSLPGPGPEIELTTLDGIFHRGREREFLTPQRLEFDLLYRVDAGETVHQVDFIPQVLSAGSVLWVRAGQVHERGDRAGLQGQIALFPPHAVPPDVAEVVDRNRDARRNSWTTDDVESRVALPQWLALFEAEPAGAGTATRSALRRSALSALILRLTTRPEGVPEDTGAGGGEYDETFHWFRAEVEAQFRSTHHVTEYARRLGRSTKTLTRAAAARGTTPKAVIDDRLVLEAQRLLVFTERTVADIAAELGFDDPSNFSTFFRRSAGLTPNAFRLRTPAQPV